MTDPADTINDLKKQIEQLSLVIANLENTSKMLVRRDIDLRKAYENNKTLDRQKSDFVAIAAHQLRTPLTTSRWAHKMLAESDQSNLTEQQKLLLERSTKSIELMHSMTEELIQLDQLEYGITQLSLTSGRVEKLLEDIMLFFKPAIEQKNITFSTQYQNTACPYFEPKKIRDALSNIIDNAIKYSQGGSTITITTKVIPGSFCIGVEDTGIGIAVEDVPKLFQKFGRLDAAIKIDANGSGLGLYISKKIIEAHKGTLEYKSGSAGGSIFTVKIPYLNI